MALLSPPAGFNSWEEFYRARAANPEMFGDGTSMSPSYQNRVTEIVATNPLMNFFVPGSEQFLKTGQKPQTSDVALAGFDAASGILPLGAIAGAVSKTPAAKAVKEGAVTIKEFLTDLLSKPLDKGTRPGKGNILGKEKVYKKVKEASQNGEISDLSPGKGMGVPNIEEAIKVWIESGGARETTQEVSKGSLDNWVRKPPAGGTQNIKIAETWDTGLGYLPNVPAQRKFLSELKTEQYPEGYGNLVDDMTDEQVAAHLRDYKTFLRTGQKDRAYMRPLGSDHVSYNVSGKHISANPELQQQAASMAEEQVMEHAKGLAYNYVTRGGLQRSQIDDKSFNDLVNAIAVNLRERNRQFKVNAPLWQLNQPMIALQTHHGNPIRFGGSSIDPRNLFAVSGGLQQAGTHRLMHNVNPKELEAFYTSLRGQHYNPFYEAALKTARKKEEPYSGFLNIVQEADPNLWDFNMRSAYDMWNKKR